MNIAPTYRPGGLLNPGSTTLESVNLLHSQYRRHEMQITQSREYVQANSDVFLIDERGWSGGEEEDWRAPPIFIRDRARSKPRANGATANEMAR